MAQLFGAGAVKRLRRIIPSACQTSKATWTQNFDAFVAGTVASITVAAPPDTIKTCIQYANFEQKMRGAKMVRDLLRIFWCRLDLRFSETLVVGPKLVFSYTFAQSLLPWFAPYV